MTIATAENRIFDENGVPRIGALRRTRKGIALIEVAMTLGIAALVAAGALFYYNTASENSRTNEAMGQIAALQELVRTMYQGQGSYNGLSNTLVAQNPMLANKYRNCGTTTPCVPSAGTGVVSPFSRPVTFAPTNETGATGTTHFSVTFEGVPRSACARLATADLGTGMVQITVTPTGGGGGGGGGTTAAGRPLTPTEANTACANGANIRWVFA